LEKILLLAPMVLGDDYRMNQGREFWLPLIGGLLPLPAHRES
jgi:hypothetical protein